MKIRIKGNSVRYRLTKTEVETFCKTGYFEERTEFNAKTLTYALKVVDADNLGADFQEDTITLLVPRTYSQDWFENDRVGFENTMILDQNRELFLLLEKDFACLDNTTEDQSDNYPNPKAC